MSPRHLDPRSQVLCRGWTRGSCHYGAKCVYSHGDAHKAKEAPEASSARPADRRSKIPCRDWAQGNCSYGAKCVYSHEDAHKAEQAPGASSTKPADPSTPRHTNAHSEVPCKLYARGNCWRGEKCLFLHQGASESKDPSKAKDDFELKQEAEAPPAKPAHPSPSRNSNAQGKRVCNSYAQGHCRFGDNCRYSHQDTSEPKAPSESKDCFEPKVKAAEEATGAAEAQLQEKTAELEATKAQFSSLESELAGLREELGHFKESKLASGTPPATQTSWSSGTSTTSFCTFYTQGILSPHEDVMEADDTPKANSQPDVQQAPEANEAPNAQSKEALKYEDRSPQNAHSRTPGSPVAQTRKTCLFYAAGTCQRGEKCSFLHEDASEGPSPTKRHPTAPNSPLAKIRCQFFASGTCRNGDNCPFTHQEAPQPPSVGDVQTPPAKIDWRAQVPCKYFASGTCRDGLKCPFYHPEVEPPQAPNVPPEDMDRLAQPSGLSGKSQVLCQFFAKGTCRDGSGCPYSHEEGKVIEKAFEKGVSPSHHTTSLPK